MKYGYLEGLEKPVSRLVIGSMVCSTDSLPQTFALLDAWVLAGGNSIDTARVYGGGSSESAVGEWLMRRDNRSRIVLIGKGAHPDNHGARVNREGIEADIAESLRRLKTNYIDIYLLHRDDPSVPVSEIIDTLNRQHDAGRINLFGGSNWTLDRIREANSYARTHGLQGFSLSSPYYGLAQVNAPMWNGCLALDAAGLAWHQEQQYPLFPWSSQASGFFTGRYSPENRENADIARVYYNEGNWERLRRARELATERGCTANNIALAYVLNLPLPVFPLVGPRTLEELETTLPALNITLSPEERRWLNLETDIKEKNV